MEKILKIDGKDIRFKSTGAFALRYKMQFRRDALIDIFKMQNAVETVQETVINPDTNEEEIIEKKVLKDVDALDLEVFYNLIWTLAKTADPSIKPPMEWLDEFEEFPMYEIIDELYEMICNSLESTVQSKKKQ